MLRRDGGWPCAAETNRKDVLVKTAVKKSAKKQRIEERRSGGSRRRMMASGKKTKIQRVVEEYCLYWRSGD